MPGWIDAVNIVTHKHIVVDEHLPTYTVSTSLQGKGRAETRPFLMPRPSGSQRRESLPPLRSTVLCRIPARRLGATLSPLLFMASTLISLPCLRLAMPYRAGLRHRVSSQCFALPMRRASALFLYSPLPFTAIIAVSWQVSSVRNTSEPFPFATMRDDAVPFQLCSVRSACCESTAMPCLSFPLLLGPHRLETSPKPLLSIRGLSLSLQVLPEVPSGTRTARQGTT